VDFDATSQHSASVSIHKFRDGDYTYGRNLEIVPNFTSPNILKSLYVTTIIRSFQPDTLTASISWKRTSGQDVLILDIKIVDTTLLGRVKEFLPSFRAQPLTTGAFLQYAAYISIATVLQSYTQSIYFTWANFFTRAVFIGQLLMSIGSLQPDAPSVWNILKYALFFLALATLFRDPAVVHALMAMVWAPPQRIFGNHEESGLMVASSLYVVASFLFYMVFLPLRGSLAGWMFAALSTVGLQSFLAVWVYYGMA
jgi:hypothetical protein